MGLKEKLYEFSKHLVIWGGVCGMGAWPSYTMAKNVGYDVNAMRLGVLLFIVFYSVVSSSSWFNQLYRNPTIRRALYFGFGLRVMISLMVFLGVAVFLLIPTQNIYTTSSIVVLLAFVIDGYLGFLATSVSAWIFGPAIGVVENPEQFASPISNTDFIPTFFATILQGIFLNIIIFLTMLLAVLVQWIWRKAAEKVQHS